MNESEKISVIITVYNTEQYLETSVRSAMNQTYRNLEIICVNDGSTDGSLTILEKLKNEDNRITIVNKPNTGIGDTRNYGLRNATSEWITFLDSDDFLTPDAYGIISREAFGYNPDMIHFGTEIIYKDRVGLKAKDEKYYSIPYEGLRVANKRVRTGTDCVLWNKLFKKSIIEKYNIHFENILYEDYQFVQQYRCVINNVFFIKDKLYNYIRHKGSIMAKTFGDTPRSIDHMRAFGYVAEFLEKNNLLEKHANIACDMFTNCYLCAIRHATEPTIPSIVELAKKIRVDYRLLAERFDIHNVNGTIIFCDNKYVSKKNLSSRLLESIFSIKKAYVNYRLCKVFKLFGIIIYKKRCLL